jgi:hypothetical protein
MSPLSPLDLLSLSDAEQAIVRHLNRNPKSTLVDLATVTHLPLETLETILRQMINACWLAEYQENGTRFFHIQYRHDVGRTRTKTSSLLNMF